MRSETPRRCRIKGIGVGVTSEPPWVHQGEVGSRAKISLQLRLGQGPWQGAHPRLAWQMDEKERADDNGFAPEDPEELKLKTPTPDLLFQEDDFLAARRSHWRPPGLG